MGHHVSSQPEDWTQKTWCKGNEETRDCGSSCTKFEVIKLRKGPKTWCKGNGRTRFCGSSCTKSEGLELRKGPKTWCKRNGRTRFCGNPCTKSKGLKLRKGPKTWCKGNGRTGFCGTPCTKSEAAERRLPRNPTPEILHYVLSPTRIPYFLAMKEAAVPSAQRLLPYILLFLGLQVQRQRPRHSYGDRKSGEVLSAWAAPHPPGSALATRTETASPAKPFPLGQRPIRPAAPHQRGEAFACPPGVACTSRAYIGRLGMCTVKVVPLPGTLST